MAAQAVPINDSRNVLQAWFDTKAASDLNFRKQLVTNPQTTLHTLFGKAIPADVKVMVVEETPTDFYLVRRFEGSMEPWEPTTNSQAILLSRSIHAVAMSEDSFWETIKANPKQVVGQRFGLNLGASVNVHVVEENATTVYLVLHHDTHYVGWKPPVEVMAKVQVSK